MSPKWTDAELQLGFCDVSKHNFAPKHILKTDNEQNPDKK